MEDLTAASYDDVVAFFKQYYAPSNASLVVAGDIDPAATRQLVEKWFSDVKPGAPAEPMTIPGVALTERPEEDDHRSRAAAAAVPRLADAAGIFAPGDAALDVVSTCCAAARTRGSTSGSSTTCRSRRAFSAFQGSQALSSSFVDRGDAAARPHRRGAAEGHRRGDREAPARGADRRARCSGR